MSQRGPFDPQALARRMPGGSLEHEGVVFDLVGDEPADVVFIQNYLRYDQKITAKQGYVWKWNNEPIVRKPIEHGIDRVYTHLHLPDNPEAHTAPPVLDWWVEKTFDELDSMEPPRKSGDLSVIASTKVDIPGHIQRHQFIARLEAEFPDVDIFGHGRARSLEDKWDGIAPYRYSIAIENTSKDDYWTEKIADCFLSYTVPLYFGATNISDYFPEDSYIWLPIDNPERAIEVVRHTLASDHWADRLEALREARHRILHRYSLYAQLATRVRAEADQIRLAPRHERVVHGRRTKPGGWIRGLGLVGNIRARMERRRQRMQRKRALS
jgi:hypothetical protein